MAVPDHPNTPRRTLLALAFAGIVVAGVLGGTIGYGLVDTTCTETPTLAQQLVADLDGDDPDLPSCDQRLLGGALAGTAVAASGAAVVAILMLRAHSEWRAHPPGSPVSRARSGGTPPRS